MKHFVKTGRKIHPVALKSAGAGGVVSSEHRAPYVAAGGGGVAAQSSVCLHQRV